MIEDLKDVLINPPLAGLVSLLVVCFVLHDILRSFFYILAAINCRRHPKIRRS